MQLALKFGKNGLTQSAQIWQMLSMALDLTPEKTAMWAEHPLGKKLAFSAIQHFEERRDA